MTGKCRFLYIIVVIIVCVSVKVVFSGKVNAANEPAAISIKWDNDSNDRPPKWAKKKNKKGKKNKDSDDKPSDDKSSDDNSSDDSSASPHH